MTVCVQVSEGGARQFGCQFVCPGVCGGLLSLLIVLRRCVSEKLCLCV